MPGRVRFRLPRDRRTNGLMDEVTGALQGLEGVLSITANPGTGSILIQHDPEVLGDEKLVRYAQDVHIISNVAQEAPELSEWPRTSDSARAVIDSFRRFDQFVSRASRGTVDGKMVVIGLLVGGSVARALWGRRQIPAPWHALLWYGYSMFMQWHHPAK